MITILFWNINKKPLTQNIVSLCHNYEVDLLILAESRLTDKDLLIPLNTGLEQIYTKPLSLNNYLSFYHRYPLECFTSLDDEERIATRRLISSVGEDIIIVALHLPSKLYKNPQEQLLKSARVADKIREIETRCGHNQTLVIGDFNMNPFEDGMIYASGFHGVMTQEIARKLSRIVDQEEKFYLYNPMWGRMGDYSAEPSGTYYYQKGEACYFWNMFDQVLLRPNLLDFFEQDNLHIISEIDGQSLMKNGKIDGRNFSDHLPIIISLDFNRRKNNV